MESLNNMIESGAFTPKSNYIGTRNIVNKKYKNELSKILKRKKPIKIGIKGKDLGGFGKYFDIPASLAGESLSSE